MGLSVLKSLWLKGRKVEVSTSLKGAGAVSIYLFIYLFFLGSKYFQVAQKSFNTLVITEATAPK